MSTPLKFPTETVTLPSKGLLYPKQSPLSSGTIEMKYMTAKEEDILTNANYLQQGTVIDKLLESLITTPGVVLNDLLVGDKNAILIAARVLGYGKEYEVEYNGKPHKVDLSLLTEKVVDETLFQKGENKFSFTLPSSGTILEFKLLNGHDEIGIEEELKGLKKIYKDNVPEGTTRLRHQILSVDGDESKKTINDFVNNYFLAQDARAFRKYVNQIQPDLDLTFYPENGPDGGVRIPIGVSFFWPDSSL
jgi:hypothetical protein